MSYESSHLCNVCAVSLGRVCFTVKYTLLQILKSIDFSSYSIPIQVRRTSFKVAGTFCNDWQVCKGVHDGQSQSSGVPRGETETTVSPRAAVSLDARPRQLFHREQLCHLGQPDHETERTRLSV